MHSNDFFLHQPNQSAFPYHLVDIQLPNFNHTPVFGSPNLYSPMPNLSPAVNPYSFFGNSAPSVQTPGFFTSLTQQQLNPANSFPDLAKDLSMELLTPPAGVSTGLLVLDAAKTGYELNQNIQRDLANGVPSVEAHVCQTGKTLIQSGLNTLGTGFIIGGVPAYLAASIENPALLLAMPAVIKAIPEAYHNVGILSQAAGSVAEQGCHDLFAKARQLSGGGK